MKLSKLVTPKSSGFTLIELLIVIAVIGVLASVVLAVINPLEQLAKSRDAGRRNAISQLSKSLSAIYISTYTYPAVGAWSTDIVSAGEMKVMPAPITGVTTCTNNVINGFCYQVGTSEAMVYTRLESSTEKIKCTVAGTVPFYLWSSADAKSGTVCLSAASEPTAAQATAGLTAAAYK